MRNKKLENQEKWRQIVREAESCPASLAAYCRNKGIPKGTLYHWRRKLQEGSLLQNVTSVNPFSRVEVVASRPALPDAQWVAEFVGHLMGYSK